MTIKSSNKIVVKGRRIKSYIEAIKLLLRVHDRVYLVSLNRNIPKALHIDKKSGKIMY